MRGQREGGAAAFTPWIVDKAGNDSQLPKPIYAREGMVALPWYRVHFIQYRYGSDGSPQLGRNWAEVRFHALVPWMAASFALWLVVCLSCAALKTRREHRAGT
jgi:hypothetical protein